MVARQGICVNDKTTVYTVQSAGCLGYTARTHERTSANRTHARTRLCVYRVYRVYFPNSVLVACMGKELVYTVYTVYTGGFYHARA